MPKKQHPIRTLLDGSKVREYKDVMPIKINTHAPEKWVAVDLETGDVWAMDSSGSPHRYKGTILISNGMVRFMEKESQSET